MRLRSFVITVSLLALFAGPGEAQVTLNTTALAAEVTTSTQRSITLDSASNITANTNQLYVGNELMVVTSCDTTSNICQVSRTGTVSTHGIDDVVFITQAGSVVSRDLYGTCVTTSTFRPTINAGTGRLFDCSAGYWQERASTSWTVYRQEFDATCLRREEADWTVELVTDAAVNHAQCAGGIQDFSYRLDGAQASPFLVIGGTLDIDNDGANDEGVEVVATDLGTSTDVGWIEIGVDQAAYVRGSFTIASVSGTDTFAFGMRTAATYVDDVVLETYDTYAVYTLNDNAGNIEIQTGADGTDADDEDDQVATWADGETHVLEVRVTPAGVFTFFIDGLTSTITTATGAADAGDLMNLFFFQLNAADVDTETNVNWLEIGFLNDTSEF